MCYSFEHVSPLKYLPVLLIICVNICPSLLIKSDKRLKEPEEGTSIEIRQKRTLIERSRACEMLISFDEPFWRKHQQNMTELVKIAEEHVEKLNLIFMDQIFIGDYKDLYFRLARVQVCNVLYQRKSLYRFTPPPGAEDWRRITSCTLSHSAYLLG